MNAIRRGPMEARIWVLTGHSGPSNERDSTLRAVNPIGAVSNNGDDVVLRTALHRLFSNLFGAICTDITCLRHTMQKPWVRNPGPFKIIRGQRRDIRMPRLNATQMQHVAIHLDICKLIALEKRKSLDELSNPYVNAL